MNSHSVLIPLEIENQFCRCVSVVAERERGTDRSRRPYVSAVAGAVAAMRLSAIDSVFARQQKQHVSFRCRSKTKTMAAFSQSGW